MGGVNSVGNEGPHAWSVLLGIVIGFVVVSIGFYMSSRKTTVKRVKRVETTAVVKSVSCATESCSGFVDFFVSKGGSASMFISGLPKNAQVGDSVQVSYDPDNVSDVHVVKFQFFA